ncbi:hypothetical protein [Alienimonas chondri]|uniref:DUF1963 domain-containing protein n=1 Tax=Alienimonas chondri TaxID=2681879 RepID=A0ABX1VKG2_9PLAN|nr:hypothetical protein [Alienimonas chondri]NNJ27905.1 hypothetical protein [Alienimonas chondri]
MPAAQLFLEGHPLVPAFNFGCLRFEGADRLELEDGFWSIEDAEASLRLSASYPPDSPWRGNALVVFYLYRFPKGEAEYRETVGRFRENEKAKVRVPGVGAFADDVLQPFDLPDGWAHDRFARSGRDLFHLYESSELGLMIRWSYQGGDASDHPLLRGVEPTVSLIPNQWATDPPPQRSDPFAAAEDEDDDGAEDDDFVPAIDLRAEAEAFRAFLKKRLAEFDPQNNYGPGGEGPITLTTVGADTGQGGWIAVVFDTRPGAEPDGEYTLFLDEGTMLYRPHWTDCCDHLFEQEEAGVEDGGIAVTELDGTITTQTEIDALGEQIGRVLAIVVAEERKTLPAGVPNDDKTWSVEDFDGGWAYFGPYGDTL